MASKNFKIPARNSMIPANGTHPAPRVSMSTASLGSAVKSPDLTPDITTRPLASLKGLPRHFAGRGPLTPMARAFPLEPRSS